MLALARALGVSIYAPSSRWIASFFSSPYTPHIMGRAIDVTTSYVFGEDALSPIDGVVEKIMRIEAGPGPFERYDYVVLIRCGRLWAKLMHIRPSVSINERVRVGDPIGRYIRTNFLSVHHLPHIHVEIHRDRSLRPSRALLLSPSEELLALMKARKADLSRSNIARLRVVHSAESYTLLEPIEGEALCVTTRIGGVEVVVNGDIWEVPRYVGLIHIAGTPKPNSLVRVLGTCIGYIRKIFSSFSLAVNTRLSFRKWLYEFTSLRSMYSDRAYYGSVFGIDIAVNGVRKRSLEILIGTIACLKVDGEIRSDVATLRLENTH